MCIHKLKQQAEGRENGHGLRGSVTVETALVLGIMFVLFFALISLSVDAAVKIKEAGILSVENGKTFFETRQAAEWMRRIYAVSSGLTQ
ncbi:MAG: pilus assembly protein [Lachnospiraceae bacterium]|nr:pilus assembly protein [Lachnospiraceae bacterium]